MQIAEGLFVTLDFTLTDPKGVVIETTAGTEPITFQFGARQLLPGLSKAIAGMTVGESRKGVIAAGELVPREVGARRRVPKSEWPAGAAPKVGNRFTAKDAGAGQALQLEVVAVDDAGMDVAQLHPLHDVEVSYDVTVRAVRRPNVPPPAPVAVEEDLTDALLDDVEG